MLKKLYLNLKTTKIIITIITAMFVCVCEETGILSSFKQ